MCTLCVPVCIYGIHCPRSATVKEQEAAKNAAIESAENSTKEAMEATALVQRQAEEAKENATAVGQWLVTLGLEQEELKEKLTAAQSNRFLYPSFWLFVFSFLRPCGREIKYLRLHRLRVLRVF